MMQHPTGPTELLIPTNPIMLATNKVLLDLNSLKITQTFTETDFPMGHWTLRDSFLSVNSVDCLNDIRALMTQ